MGQAKEIEYSEDGLMTARWTGMNITLEYACNGGHAERREA